MYIIDQNTPVRRVPGLKGSDSARAENLDATGPNRPLGGQPLFGSGSNPDGDGGNLGSQGDCVGDIATPVAGASGGGPPGGSNNPDNDMTRPGQNGCWQSNPIINRPPTPCKCPPPPKSGAGGPGGGPGCPPCRGDL